MQWITDMGAKLRSEIMARPWRQKLSGENLAWVHQLAHQSVEFTQTLGLQWAMSNDRRMRDTHAQHVVEEAGHPAQLKAWMDSQLLLVEAPFLGVPPTDETVLTMAFNMRVSMREPLGVRVAVLNVLGEGVALDAFTSMIDVLQPTGRLKTHAKFWKIHKVADATHLLMGLEDIGHVDQNTTLGRDIMRLMRLGAKLYGDMLDSWM